MAVIENTLGTADVVEITNRPSYSGYLLDGDLDDFHTAVDRLDRETCRGTTRCQGGKRCRRHTRRKQT